MQIAGIKWIEASKLIETASDAYKNYKSSITLKNAFDSSQKTLFKLELN